MSVNVVQIETFSWPIRTETHYCTDVGSSEAEQIARDSRMIAECGRLLGARGRDDRKLFVLHGKGSNREEENF